MIVCDDEAFDVPETQRFFVGRDESGHRYLVEWDRREDWDKWTQLYDQPEGWNTPSYAKFLDGGTLTFTCPEISRW